MKERKKVKVTKGKKKERKKEKRMEERKSNKRKKEKKDKRNIERGEKSKIPSYINLQYSTVLKLCFVRLRIFSHTHLQLFIKTFFFTEDALQNNKPDWMRTNVK